MRAHEIIEARINKRIPIIYKALELQSGEEVMGMVDLRKNKVYVINASISDFDRFKKWEGIRTEVDLQKAGSTSIMSNGKKLENMNIKTQFGDKPEEKTGDEEL